MLQFTRMQFGLALSVVLSLAAVQPADATFVPEDEIRSDLTVSGTPNLNEQEFEALLLKIETAYSPVAKALGGKLSISGDWSSKRLNAGATQFWGRWKVKITGELARRPELTPDGFSLIVCHELGHHLAGFPLNPPEFLIGLWAATEGQADYFATQVCARKIWAGDVALNATFRNSASEFVQRTCNSAWKTPDDQNLCYRIATAAESTTLTMANIKKVPAPNYEKPDLTQVPKTSLRHPSVQCRMDTSLQGALCSASWDESLIPGKETKAGYDSLDAEHEAAKTSCMSASGYTVGLRPTCWFKARL